MYFVICRWWDGDAIHGFRSIVHAIDFIRDHKAQDCSCTMYKGEQIE